VGYKLSLVTEHDEIYDGRGASSSKCGGGAVAVHSRISDVAELDSDIAG
jgi:hypothetical protein